MKRTLALALALVCATALSACAARPTVPTEPTETMTAIPTSATTTTTVAATEEMSPAKTLLAAFRAELAQGAPASMEALAQKLIAPERVPFVGAAMPVEPGPLNGFRGEITGFAEGASFGPMIGAIPFVGYVFRLEDGADADAFVKTLKAQGDLRWNICTQADELVAEAEGNTVFFVMAPASFDKA